jgi:4-hydroxybenzoate polyprenyltransferase
MLKLKAILTIIRFPNLVFIALTQILTYYCLILPSVKTSTLTTFQFSLLTLSTVLIATAGYIINDYFDIGIDAVNKPQKVTIENVFKRRTIILWHIGLNVIALIIAGKIAYHYIQFRMLGFQLFSILLLVLYSTTLKRKLIIGNFSIGVLTALTLITTAIYEPNFRFWDPSQPRSKLFWVYVIFAFLITIIREIIKDIEDIKGDAIQQCKTIPLVWGINSSKNIIYGLLTILFLFLILVGFVFVHSNLIMICFLGVFVFIPLIWLSRMLFKAQIKADFHALSSMIKWITLMGILSMLLI